MYQEGQVLGAAAPLGAGIAALPATGGNPVFTIAAYAAITIGVTAVVLQLVAGIYRFSSRAK
ncbi:MAG TPA: hypothetical protein VJ836_02935 [Candidatus Saccharimonadales bacterium]|nr:hypothetical protein [Candidatus Saccharimonadales bacterium]